MKKILYIFIIILVLIIIFLNFYKSKKNILEDHTIFNMWDEYVINPEKNETVQIDIFKKINDGNKVRNKIAPGSTGSFIIKLIRPKKSSFDLEIRDITYKPKNLIFILEDKKFNSMEEMQEDLKQKFLTNNNVIINWQWKYENNEEDDIEDTKDGKKAKSYIFEMNAIIEE